MEEGRINLMLGFLLVLYASLTSTRSADTISANQIIRYNQTIVSPQETFELGFFSPGKSTNHYIGIWYKKISTGTVVWVANRNSPLTDTTGEITLTPQGLLILRNITGNIVWSSSSSSTPSSVTTSIGRLLDTGNFIVYEDGNINNQNNPIWQSFDFLTDTFLPGMKIGRDLVTGNDRNFTSWKSDDDPAAGNFSASLDTSGYPQSILRYNGEIMSRAGPWNGLRFSGLLNLGPNPIYRFKFVFSQREIYYQYDLINTSVFTRIVVQPTGKVDRLLWIDSRQEWTVYLTSEIDNCDRYAFCGPFGSCNINTSPACECLKGFEPTSLEQWAVADWTQGCKRTTRLDCGPWEGFKKYSHLKLPDTRWSRFNQIMTLVECEKTCKSNCSCTAYTYLNISGTGTGTGCLLWFCDLIDIRTLSGNGDDIYIRLPPSELENSRSSNARGLIQVIVPVAVVTLVILVSVCLFYRFKRNKQEQEVTPGNVFGHDPENESRDEDLELSLFGLSTLLKATNNFSTNNKLGEGGFGPVYKGVLEDGHEIAVKRLAKTSTQGLREFKNEVISISKVQHRNLIKLLGCCIEGAETMLIYEYMPNKGLDSLIFDSSQSKLLDWPARYNIINGIARGLLYLHQDSRLRIIHRDLKVGNILLDLDMNPKISDFGLARSFGGNQIEGNTNRVVGTYGYMAPEYARDGTFSIKSDVYSFGVLVLEIVSRERNRGFINNINSNNLVGHVTIFVFTNKKAWELHKEGRSLQLVDQCTAESINVPQVLRTIHVCLLCVQNSPADRPTMTSVILMLGSEGPLPSPKEPAFFVGKTYKEGTANSSSSYGTCSNNELSITTLIGR